MKKLIVTVAALFVVACGAGAEKGPGEFKADFKTNALFFTNMAAAVKGTSPHGTQQTWYSSNVKDVTTKSTFTVPEGTVAIKEYDVAGDGTKDGFAVMIKKAAGYDAANNDWYYEMRGIDGTVATTPAAGKIEMCITCHKKAAASDYLAGTTIK